MTDSCQDVALRVVPPPSPLSCLPSSSDAVSSPPVRNVTNSSPTCDRTSPTSCHSDTCCYQDLLHNQEEIHTKASTSSKFTGALNVAASADVNQEDSVYPEFPSTEGSEKDSANKVTVVDTNFVSKHCSKEQVFADYNSNNVQHDPIETNTIVETAISIQECDDDNVGNNTSSSTDGTLRNSEESCESDVPAATTLNDQFVKINMGNKQSGKAVKEDDHDGRTKCCEIPKRKAKDRGSRSNRTSRTNDLDFDANEVYPFDGRIVSEHELHEPVELEPFEIVETDDIKFVPGAGTSEVIRSVSEPKFNTIPEEQSQSAVSPTTNKELTTSLKVPCYFDKGNRLIEPGTSTAHSTFEFKQVKPKTKLLKMTPDPFDHNYENVVLGTDGEQSVTASNDERKTSSSSTKSSSTSSSKDVSRNNSKEAKQKPARKGKSKTSDSPKTVVEESETPAKDVKRKQPKGKTDPAIRDSEIDRKIDSVLMLTQTMFSQAKPPDMSGDQIKKECATDSAPAIKYENVGVVAKMESTGIKIVHKDVPVKAVKEDRENSTTSVSQSQCTDGRNCETLPDQRDIAETSKKKVYPQLSSDILEISESGTLIIKSLADLPSERPDCENAEFMPRVTLDRSSDIDDNDETDLKTMYATIDDFEEQENAIRKLEETANKSDSETERKVEYETIDRLTVNEVRESSKSPVEIEEVPPPSPSTMDALAEMEEEDDDDFDEVATEDKRKSAEIVEFTENVCKRLSQLLILEGQNDDESENGDIMDASDNEDEKYADHIYETIDGNYRIVNGKPSVALVENHSSMSKETDILLVDTLTLSNSESTGTLKRTSGDSETYKQARETTESISSKSSDDGMPSYFDPAQNTDSAVLCSAVDTSADKLTANDEVFEDTVPKVEGTKSNKSVFQGSSGYDNVIIEDEDDDDDVVSEPLKTFDLDLVDTTLSQTKTEDLLDRTPTAEAHEDRTPLAELANVEVETPLQYDASGRHSVTCTESDLDISEHRDDLSTDSMLADDEAEETMEILFTKTYTEPVEGAEVFLSCTVVNSAYKEEHKRSETWLSDEAMEYFEANASEVMSTAFLKAKKEMKDIQICLQSLRQQMEHFHSDCEDSLPEIPVDSLSPDYFGKPHRKAITD